MVNGKFKVKDVTWSQRKAMKKALESNGATLLRIVETQELPIDFVELAFKYGIEGFEDVERLNDLSEVELMEGASAVFVNTFVKPEAEKKS